MSGLYATEPEKLQESIKELEDHFRELASQQVILGRLMAEAPDAGSEGYRKLSDELRRVQREAKRTTDEIEMMNNAFVGGGGAGGGGGGGGGGGAAGTGGSRAARGGFTQGFAQAVLPAAFIQRGPGMGRQIAGHMAGGMVKGGLSSLGGGLARGISGIQAGIGSIPFVGGLLSGQLGQAAQYGYLAREVQKQRLGAMPFIGGESAVNFRALEGAEAGRRGGAGSDPALFGLAQHLGQAAIEDIEGTYTSEDVDQLVVGERIKRATRRGGSTGRGPIQGMGSAMGLGDMSTARIKALQEKMTGDKNAAMMEVYGTELRLRKEASSRAYAAKNAPFKTIRGAGTEYAGLAEPEAIGAMRTLLGAGGGGLGDARGQGMLGESFAAQTLYGIGAETAGGFLKGGRIGGIVGGGTGGDAMVKAIGDAMAIGLNQTELVEYVQQMAEGIRQMETTGIPFAQGAIGSMASQLADVGMRGQRGRHVAGGMAGWAQRLSSGGPEDFADMMMLRVFGGWTGQGGAAEFEDAQIRMEQLKPENADIMKLWDTFLESGGGGPAGRTIFRNLIGEKGIKVGAEELRFMSRVRSGEALSPGEQARFAEVQAERENAMLIGGAAGKGAPGSREQMKTDAAWLVDKYGAAIKAAAVTQNIQRQAGEQILGSLTKLERASTKTGKVFTDMVDGPLLKFSTMVETAAKKLELFVGGTTKAIKAGGDFGNDTKGEVP